MSDCNHNCNDCKQDCDKRINIFPLNKHSRIKKVIAIASGKGGVGKSLVTSLLAILLRKKGYNTAILDADITGPSIPKMFDVKGKIYSTDEGLIPLKTKTGIQIISSNFLLNNETDPVVWRGPIIAGLVKQFYSDVIWDDVEYLFVDMPPGTGDVPLTVFQSLSVNGLIIVTSPQELVSMIVSKAVKMAQMMKIPTLGLIENMSYLECDNCHHQMKIFGKSNVDNVAEDYGLEVLAKVPLNPKFALLCDQGRIEDIDINHLDKAIYSLERLLEK
ncbi:MAG TPA: Mrp/NBP35 family ATP-binding protein [Acholeplasmataceae bacterium]|jgi:Mrp family chromosome partitioning ATPase|nr:Mrp/NBP35 family ATP-binding protein [Acholeplasmataceae bacterium]